MGKLPGAGKKKVWNTIENIMLVNITRAIYHVLIYVKTICCAKKSPYTYKTIMILTHGIQPFIATQIAKIGIKIN